MPTVSLCLLSAGVVRHRLCRSRLPLALMLALMGPAIAAAQTPAPGNVEVDLGVLDTLDPAPAATSRVVLHAPDKPKSPQPPPRPATKPALADDGIPRPQSKPELTGTFGEPAPEPPPPPPMIPPILAAAVPHPPGAPPPPVVKAAAPARPFIATATAGTRRIAFDPAAATLSEAARQDLDDLVRLLAAHKQAHLQIVAFADGDAEQANQARRLSLARALAVRSYFLQHGVQNSRLDLRALGNRPDGDGPLDRVDIAVLDP